MTEPGDSAPVAISDINQGQIGDCFLLAALGEIVQQGIIQDRPWFIPSMIHANKSGTETVKLYLPTGGALGDATFKPVYETVTNVFPSDGVDGGPTQDVVRNQKEIWPQVVEKAYAQLNGGYAAISNGGFSDIAMEELSGKNATWMSPDGMTLSTLVALTKANDLLTFDTSDFGNLPYNLVNDHSYVFEGATGRGTSTMLHFGNPWGFDQPNPIPLSQVTAGTSGFVQVNIGHFA